MHMLSLYPYYDASSKPLPWKLQELQRHEQFYKVWQMDKRMDIHMMKGKTICPPPLHDRGIKTSFRFTKLLFTHKIYARPYSCICTLSHALILRYKTLTHRLTCWNALKCENLCEQMHICLQKQKQNIADKQNVIPCLKYNVQQNVVFLALFFHFFIFFFSFKVNSILILTVWMFLCTYCSLYTYITVFDLITAHTPISAVKQFRSLQITASVLFAYFFV